MLSDILIFANPVAGRGRGQRLAERLSHRLSVEGHRPRLFLEPADSIHLRELRASASAALVIGGDGTLRTVARRVVEDFATGDIPPLLIVPLGTANLMGQHLGIRWDQHRFEEHLLQTLRQPRIVQLDVGMANGAMFLEMVSVGLDADIVHRLSRLRRGPITKLSYIRPGLAALFTYDFPPVTVILDGQTVLRHTPALVFAGNVREYGTGFPMLPHARSDDGLLDVCVMPCATRRDAIRLVVASMTGEHLHAEGVIYRKVRQIQVQSDQPVPIQMDGEAAGFTPLAVALHPTRVPFIVPQASDQWPVISDQRGLF